MTGPGRAHVAAWWRPGLVAGLAMAALLTACARQAPPGAASEAAAGDALVAAGKFAEAASTYRRAVDAAPQDGALRLKLARTLERAQQWGPAGQEAMRAADLLPGSYEAGLLAARLVLGQSRYDDSLALSTPLLEARPDDVDLLVIWSTATAGFTSPYWAVFKLGPTGGRGETYERACATMRPVVGPHRDIAAEATLRRALALAPQHFDARFALIGLLWATRRADDAEALLTAFADEQPTHAMLNEAAGHYFLARGQPTLGEHYLQRAATSTAPDARAPRLALADHYLAGARFAEVLRLLDGVAGADDEAGVVAVRRAEATLGLERYAEATRQLDVLLQRYPSHVRALTLKARLLLATGNAQAAWTEGDRAVRTDPASFGARVALARSLEALDDVDLAYKEYGEALRLDPSAGDLPLTLAVLGLRTGRYRAALAHARQAQERDRDDVHTTLALIEALVRTGDVAAAEKALTPLRQVVPPLIEARVLEGLILDRRGQEAAARLALDAALAARPDSVEAVTARVTLDLEHGRHELARVRAEAAVASRPQDVALLRLLGQVQRAEGDLTTAETTFRRALAVRPADTDASLLLAECLAQQRRTSEAQRILDRVLQRRPSSAVAQTLMGGVLEALGRLDDAEARYEAVLAEYPDAVDAAARLAVLLVSRGRELTAALNVLREPQRIAPNDAAVNDAYGWVQLHRDQTAVALQSLLVATRQRPNDATYHYHLGIAWLRSGKRDAARATLRRALALEASFPERGNAEAELAKLTR